VQKKSRVSSHSGDFGLHSLASDQDYRHFRIISEGGELLDGIRLAISSKNTCTLQVLMSIEEVFGRQLETVLDHKGKQRIKAGGLPSGWQLPVLKHGICRLKQEG
jgi:hypothetical protein